MEAHFLHVEEDGFSRSLEMDVEAEAAVDRLCQQRAPASSGNAPQDRIAGVGEHQLRAAPTPIIWSYKMRASFGSI